ncbi:DNA polymerase IV [Clostridium sp. 19966]|uniref:DNA polymerase Y family protein n=1 Tax=Clostridium sp. 19966 TaxID=2768166 RepID=UPI0028E06274|nr:DNA polymerase IV [Clostridium sp. 19966]MDT8717316.1 DNA polymerase IV [Clostridium sp. 19966]
MEKLYDRIIFHVDVNSAFLSWSAVDMLKKGEKIDIRNIPSAVGGDESTRHGIILAKSTSAKKYNVTTGESIYTARQKCPQLYLVPPDHKLYRKFSNEMMEILKEYTPVIEQYSIDECFLDITGMRKTYREPLKVAYALKERIKKELGFTVNVGVSTNKLLAKMASELKKPDKLNTLFPDEIEEKMWKLPIEELFMVGRATVPKLKAIGIYKIGDLASYDIDILRRKFKSYGNLLWNYANGIDNSKVTPQEPSDIKSIGNSTTLAVDIKDTENARKVIISLCESVGKRLREAEKFADVVQISLKNDMFIVASKQKKLKYKTDCTQDIIKEIFNLFQGLWKGEPLRYIGISVSGLSTSKISQLSFFDDDKMERKQKLDKTIDEIRSKYGSDSLVRSSLLNKKL